MTGALFCDMDADYPSFEHTNAVWNVIEQKVTREYPYINYRTLVVEARKVIPGLTSQLFDDILVELEESRRIICEEPLGPDSEIKRIFS